MGSQSDCWKVVVEFRSMFSVKIFVNVFDKSKLILITNCLFSDRSIRCTSKWERWQGLEGRYFGLYQYDGEIYR